MTYEIGKSYPMPPKRAAKRMIDIVPNNPEEFRSKVYGAHLRNKRDGLPRQDGDPSINEASTNQMFKDIGQNKISCPTCGADIGQPCISIAKSDKSAMLNTIHPKRFSMAKRIFARKA